MNNIWFVYFMYVQSMAVNGLAHGLTISPHLFLIVLKIKYLLMKHGKLGITARHSEIATVCSLRDGCQNVVHL